MSRKVYENYDKPAYRNSFKDFINWRIERSKKRKDFSQSIPQTEKKLVSYLCENKSDTSITWIGHSTFLIQINGLNIMTDPVYANQMAFTKRLSNPGIELSELPQIDMICISHGHYDHLDFNTIRHFSKDTMFLIPIGLKNKFTNRGYRNVFEMSWWDTKNLAELILHYFQLVHTNRNGL